MNFTSNPNIKFVTAKLVLLVWIILAIQIFTAFFGKENLLLAVTIITAHLMLSKVHIGIETFQASCIILCTFLYISIVTYISPLNPFWGLFLDFFSIFFIAYVFSIKLEYQLYIPFILCYLFLEGNPITPEQFYKRIIAMIVGCTVVALTYWLAHKNNTDKEILTFKKALQIDFSALRFNFCLRLAASISIAMYIGAILGFAKPLWIGASAFSVTQPYYHQLKERIWHRMFGTLIGAALFILIFIYVLDQKYTETAILFLSFLYSFVQKYHYQVIFITINSLAAAQIIFTAEESIPMRIFFVFLGILIATIINKLLYNKKLDLETTK